MTTRAALDANLLLLLVVGTLSSDWIISHKRLKQYDVAAYDLLMANIAGADKILTTPNVLTEVSNMLDFGVFEPRRSELWQGFAEFIISAACEVYHPSSTASGDVDFGRLGLSDCAWLGCMDAETVLFTDDLPLFLTATSRGLASVHFTRLRIEAGLLPE